MLAMAKEYVIINKPKGVVTDDKRQAAGITSLIQSISMLQHQTIPPHPCAEVPLNGQLPTLYQNNTHIPWESLPFHPCDEDGRRILINNFNGYGMLFKSLSGFQSDSKNLGWQYEHSNRGSCPYG